MISEDEILSVIAHGENHTTEFKRQIDNLERLAGELVAFANSDGGALYIGVDDDGSVPGLDDANDAFQTLTSSC